MCFLFICFLVIIFPYSVQGGNFGPDEWHQYRLNHDKNAVFNNGSQPLEFRVFKTANEVRATPVVAGNKLFIGNHDTGELFAFDVHTGEKIWENKAPNWIHSEMIFHDGKVYVGMGNRFFQDDGIRGTGKNGVIALNAETGDVLWQYNTDGEVMPTPAYHNGAIYIATGDRHLYKLDPDSGELLHKAKIGSTVSMSAPNITENTLYVGGSGPLPYTFSAYDLEKDEFKWKTEFTDVIAGLDDVPPAVMDNVVVTTAVEGSYDDPEHIIYGMDTETGEILWQDNLGTGQMVKNNKSGAPMIYEGKIYVGSPITKAFYAYDLKSGEKLWEFKNNIIKAPPVAQDGIVYFSNTEGYVYAMDAETGEKLARKKLGGTLAPSGPIIINDTLIVGSQDSNVYALPLTDFDIDNDINASQAPSNKDNFTVGVNGHFSLYMIGIGLGILLVIILVLLRKRKA